MPIDNCEGFDLTWDLVTRNCAGAIRSFSAIDYPLSDPKPYLASLTIKHLVDHTFRSGALCICRIWDKNSRSVDDLIDALFIEPIKNKYKIGCLRKLEFLNAVNDEAETFAKLLEDTEISNDDEAYIALVEAIKYKCRGVSEIPTKAKLTNYRNGFLGHSTGLKVTSKNRSDFEEAKEFLISTLRLIDDLQWLLANSRQHLAGLNYAIDDALCSWEENRLLSTI